MEFGRKKLNIVKSGIEMKCKVIFQMDKYGNITTLPISREELPSLFFQMEEDKELLINTFLNDEDKDVLKKGWPITLDVDIETYKDFNKCRILKYY